MKMSFSSRYISSSSGVSSAGSSDSLDLLLPTPTEGKPSFIIQDFMSTTHSEYETPSSPLLLEEAGATPEVGYKHKFRKSTSALQKSFDISDPQIMKEFGFDKVNFIHLIHEFSYQY